MKGFTMDDERLKNPPGKGQLDYFDELLERIRGAERRGHILRTSALSAEPVPIMRFEQTDGRTYELSA